MLVEGGGGSTNIWKIPYVSSFCFFLKASLSFNPPKPEPKANRTENDNGVEFEILDEYMSFMVLGGISILYTYVIVNVNGFWVFLFIQSR